jgi:hypothetical protein
MCVEMDLLSSHRYLASGGEEITRALFFESFEIKG